MTTGSFRSDLEGLINSYSLENGSNTPDWILAQYLTDSLAAFDKAVSDRHNWFGHPEPFAVAGDVLAVVE